MKRGAVSTLMVAVAVAITACAGQEMADEEPEALAAEPQLTQGVENGEPAAPSIDEDESLSFDLPPSAETQRERLDKLGTSIDVDDGVAHCELDDGQFYTAFFVEAAGVVVRSCCDDGGQCLSQIHFTDEDRHLLFVGPVLEATHFSPDATALVTPGDGASVDNGSIAIVDITEVLSRAESVDEAPPVVDAEAILDGAKWTVDAGRLHAAEGLSARAVEEAMGPCERGVHLPTFLELAEDSQPLSAEMTLRFERWIEASTLLFSTRGEGSGWTTMVIDGGSGCMERTSATEQRSSMTGRTSLPDGFDWHDAGTVRVTIDDEHWAVFRGKFVQDKKADDAGVPSRVGAIIDRVTGAGDDGRVYVVHRLVGEGELDLWRDGALSISQLDAEPLEVAARQYGDRWTRPITILVADVETDIGLEIFPR